MPFRIAIRRRVAKCPTSDLADFRMVDETVERTDSGDSPHGRSSAHRHDGSCRCTAKHTSEGFSSPT